MSTAIPGLQAFFRLFASFCNCQLATSSISVKTLKCLAFRKRFQFNNAILMCKSVNGQSPMYLIDMFKFCIYQHGYLTRSITSLNFKIQQFKTLIHLPRQSKMEFLIFKYDNGNISLIIQETAP